MTNIYYQINLSTMFGGAEVYTRFFSEALRKTGRETVIFVHEDANFWQSVETAGFKVIRVKQYSDILTHLPASRCLLFAHERLSGKWVEELRSNHTLIGFAHQPLRNRSAEPYRLCHLLFAVSQYVIGTLREAGIQQVYPEPLFGVADITRTPPASANQMITAESPFHWDRRKVRDRAFGMLYPIYRAFVPAKIFARKKGLTLGIVSRFDNIKQFPLLFRYLSPIISEYPEVQIEIFGSGGYAAVRDLRKSLSPIRRQVRFWGHQKDVRQIYPKIDFLLPGLPEREALGLNVIEAQLCDTPVLAIKSPPFSETVWDGKTGHLYTDPRLDDGRDFSALLKNLVRERNFPKPSEFPEHLARFSLDQFTLRVAAAIEYASHHCAGMNTSQEN